MTSTTASESIPIETHHEDMIHDAQLDYYGKRLATCSSDGKVKVFDIVDGEPQKTNEQVLKGHTGPVWQVAWAHPKYGHILASCSYDGRVLIWKEQQTPASYAAGPHAQGGAGTWTKIKEHNLHSASVNSISWAPHELGAILACASSDGKLSVLTFKNDGSWDADIFNGHAIGCNAVSWAPAALPGSLIAPSLNLPNTTSPSAPASGSNAAVGAQAPGQTQFSKRFASAGCDNNVRIWGFNPASASWAEEEVLAGHIDWVRDVAWAPDVGLPRSVIATAGQDRTVLVWTRDASSTTWNKVALEPPSVTGTAGAPAVTSPPLGAASGGAEGQPTKFPDVVWRVSWSLAGNVLAVSCGDGKVTLWKENLKGTWECVNELAS